MAVKRSLAWMAAAQGSSFLMQFGASVFLARLLTPYEMGVFAVGAAIVGALGLLQAFGLQSMIVREENLTEDVIATAFSLNALICVSIAIAIAGLSFLGGLFLKDPGVQKVLLVLAISPLLEIFDFLPAAQLERGARFKAISIVNTIRGLVTSVVTVGLAVLGFKYMSIAYAQVTAQAVAVGLTCWIGRDFIRLRFGFKAFRGAARFGLQMLAIFGVSDLGRRSSEIIMARILGLSALGMYNRASGLNSLLWDRIHLVVGRVLFVDFAAHKRQGLSLRDKYLRTLETITALLWPAFGGFAVLAGPFILAVYGAKWVPAATPLAFLALASFIQVSITMTWEVFVASGELRTQMRIEFIRAGVSLSLFAVGCYFGLTGAAASRVGDAIFAVLLYRPYLQRMTDTKFTDLMPVYLRSGALTALAVLPAAILMAVYRWSPHAPLSLAIASVGLGVMLWMAGLFGLRHPLVSEVRTWLSRRKGPEIQTVSAD